MKLDIVNANNEKVGDLELNDEVFGGRVKTDLIWEAVVQENAAERRGTHATKNRALVSGGGKKPYKQKGTGRARHGAATAPQFRGGGKSFGPHPRDHAEGLPKKVRRLGLKVALSSKLAEGKLVVLDRAALDEPKTKQLAARLDKLGWSSALLIDGPEVDRNFALAARNLVGLQLLPPEGANVYDILRRDLLVLTREAVRRLEERLA